MTTRVAVFGAGGVGGYLAGRLADSAAANVHLLARGDHLAALQRDGLRLRSALGDRHVRLPATDDPADIGAVDVVVFSVKSTDTESAAAQLPPLLDEATAVISFQNGVDNERRIAEVVGARHVVGGVAYIFSTIAAPGVVDHTGGPARFVFGELDGSSSRRLRRFLDVCDDAGIEAQLSDDIRAALWSKFTLMCAVGGMTAATRLPLGALREDPAAWAMFRAIAEEVCAVAAGEGAGLPGDTAARTVALAEDLPDDAYSSLHYDLTHGKPMELDALNGTALRLGEEHGIDVPMNRAVHALLSPWARRNAR